MQSCGEERQGISPPGGPALRRAWILVEGERWWEGLPCFWAVFDDGAGPPPKIEGCFIAGHISVIQNEMRGNLRRPPQVNLLQEKVWAVVVKYAKECLLSGGAPN